MLGPKSRFPCLFTAQISLPRRLVIDCIDEKLGTYVKWTPNFVKSKQSSVYKIRIRAPEHATIQSITTPLHVLFHKELNSSLRGIMVLGFIANHSNPYPTRLSAHHIHPNIIAPKILSPMLSFNPYNLLISLSIAFFVSSTSFSTFGPTIAISSSELISNSFPKDFSISRRSSTDSFIMLLI